MKKTGSFSDLLRAEFLPPLNWKLTQQLLFFYHADDETYEVLQKILGQYIDKREMEGVGNIILFGPEPGFVTNLASVPRVFWAFISPWDIARAAVIHDYLYSKCAEKYQQGEVNKKEFKVMRKIADEVFLIAMQASEPAVPEWKIKIAHRAVRMFGNRAAIGKG